MGKGRAPTAFEYMLMEKNRRKQAKRYKKTSIQEVREKFNREFNKWYEENYGDKNAKMGN